MPVLVIKPNAGLPDPATGEHTTSRAISSWRRWKDYAGAWASILIGGCCGTDRRNTSRGLAEIAAKFGGRSSAKACGQTSEAACRFAAGARTVTVDHVTVIGERTQSYRKETSEAGAAGRAILIIFYRRRSNRSMPGRRSWMLMSAFRLSMM